MQLEKTAPVAHTESIDIQAPVEVVWSLLSKIEAWPAWNHDIKTAQLLGELAPGTTFIWKAGPGTVTSVLQAVEPNRQIGWTGKTMGIKAVHIWRLEASEGHTRATSEESWAGLLAQVLKGYSQKTLAQSTAAGLQSLKSAAEAAAR